MCFHQETHRTGDKHHNREEKIFVAGGKRSSTDPGSGIVPGGTSTQLQLSSSHPQPGEARTCKSAIVKNNLKQSSLQ